MSDVDVTQPLAALPPFLRMQDAAKILCRTTRTLRVWELQGLIKLTRPAGGRPLVPRSEIERVLSEGLT